MGASSRSGRFGEVLAAIERLAAGEELAVHGRDGADAQGVALAAPYGRPLVERGALGGLQLGGAEVVRDLARHVEGDRQLRGGRALLAGGVVGQKVGDGGTDRAAADPVVAGEGGDGAAFQVCGAYVGGLGSRHGGASPALRALGLGGPQSVVGQHRAGGRVGVRRRRGSAP
ncbi:hypothetical protein [Streptomyces sp. NPDC059256]|uniref:hypothetical protein n=1 Tax=Streptomyces sp. NPDC059256 TaxID=3346794 RepID=UPI0036B8492E